MNRKQRSIVAKFRELEAAGLARIRVEFDDDADVSWMDDAERSSWNGEGIDPFDAPNTIHT